MKTHSRDETKRAEPRLISLIAPPSIAPGVVAVQGELLDIQVGVRTAKNKGAHVSDTWLSGT